MFMSKKTYLVLQRIEADGQVYEPAGEDQPAATAQLSDEAAASLLPLGVILEHAGSITPASAKARSVLTKDAA
jgi:hypothetical protein